MNNKRGQEMSTTTIVLLILAVVVLVVLILGFTMGWSKILPWVSSNNVQTIVTSCETACATGDKFGFCSSDRELNDGTTKIKTSCATFSVFSGYSKYGISKCNTLSCNIPCASIQIKGVAAVETESCDETTQSDITSIANTATGMKCCATN